MKDSLEKLKKIMKEFESEVENITGKSVEDLAKLDINDLKKLVCKTSFKVYDDDDDSICVEASGEIGDILLYVAQGLGTLIKDRIKKDKEDILDELLDLFTKEIKKVVKGEE